MLSRSFLVIAMLLAAGRVFAISGYAHGSEHCYYFSAPDGWAMDNRAGASAGVPMVFYPSGDTWQSAAVAMYTRPATSEGGRSDSARIKEQVEQVIQLYRASSQTIQARLVQPLRSKAGASGELWEFTGYTNGGIELAAYFPAPQTVNFFVMQVPRAADADSNMPAIVELASSYRPAVDCKPCAESGACTVER